MSLPGCFFNSKTSSRRSFLASLELFQSTFCRVLEKTTLGKLFILSVISSAGAAGQ